MYPEDMRHKVKDNHGVKQPPTYEIKHELVGKLPFDFSNFVNTYDFKNAPDEVRYESGLNILDEHNENKTIGIRLKKLNNEFSQNVIKCFEGPPFDLKRTDMMIYYQPKNALTLAHCDGHARFRRRYGLENLDISNMHEVIIRYWVPLKDWSMGQYFEINGIPIKNWKAGDIYRLYPKYPHCGATLGNEPGLRFIVTGVKY